MSILVTGSSGMIGTNLCLDLLKKGEKFIGVDRIPNRWSEVVNSRTVVSDLLNSNWADVVPSGVTTIVHLAANARVELVTLDPDQAYENMVTTFRILEFARIRGIRKLIFASSKEVYGNVPVGKASEGPIDLAKNENPYAASKIAGEALVHSYYQCFGLDSIILRFTNVYGLYDMYNRAVPMFVRQSLRGQSVVVYDKEKALDFVYAGDVVRGITLSLQHFKTAKNGTYNIGAGEATPIVELAEIIQKLCYKEKKIRFAKRKPGEVMRFAADISAAAKKLNYTPQYTLRAGLQRTINWFKSLPEYDEGLLQVATI